MEREEVDLVHRRCRPARHHRLRAAAHRPRELSADREHPRRVDAPISKARCRPSSSGPITTSARTPIPTSLRTTVAHASERQDLNRRVLTLRAEVQELGDREFVAGPSRAMRDVLEVVHKVGKLSATVLILGESGTGKELLARMIHRESSSDGAGPARRPIGRSSPSTSRPSRASSSRARSSATSAARSPARCSSASASSSWPAAARCSSTRSAISGWSCRPSCCARFRKARSSASAAASPSRRRSG